MQSHRSNNLVIVKLEIRFEICSAYIYLQIYMGGPLYTITTKKGIIYCPHTFSKPYINYCCVRLCSPITSFWNMGIDYPSEVCVCTEYRHQSFLFIRLILNMNRWSQRCERSTYSTQNGWVIQFIYWFYLKRNFSLLLCGPLQCHHYGECADALTGQGWVVIEFIYRL